MAKQKNINDIAATVKEVTTATRTLNRYSDAIKAHLDELSGEGERRVLAAKKSLGQVFNAATKGRDRVTPGMIKTLANNSLAKLQGYREDIAIDAGQSVRVKTDSAMIRHGGAIVTNGAVDKLEAAAKAFIALYSDFRSDAVINDDKTLSLDVESEVPADVIAG